MAPTVWPTPSCNKCNLRFCINYIQYNLTVPLALIDRVDII